MTLSLTNEMNVFTNYEKPHENAMNEGEELVTNVILSNMWQMLQVSSYKMIMILMIFDEMFFFILLSGCLMMAGSSKL